MPRGSNLPRLADYNQAVVLDLVRRDPGRSRADLQRVSGLASQTISNITRRLIDTGMIRESAPADTSRGRPSIPLSVDPDGACAVGVHVDPARLTVLLLDIAGGIRDRRELRTPQSPDPDDTTALIATSVDAMIRASGVDRARVLGLGVAVPGPLDVRTGVMIAPPQLPRWRHVRLRADLHEATGLPVLLDKDVTAAATAELRASADADFLFLYLGSGVGASVVAEGRVLRGVSNNIGEIGDILVDPAAEDLGWGGRRGGLAAACVPEALVIQAVQAGLMPLPDLADYLALDDALTRLSELAGGGDPAAVALLARAARRVASGIAVLVNFLDVPRVVLGGPAWNRLRDAFLPVLEDAVQRELVVPRPGFRVVGSAVGEQIAAQGAAELVLDSFLAPHASVLVMG
ncbi:putative NBD/HSP70 family sugar kinase [Clavibacter michiganensis]|uniref:ROK family transcriptional regulator n=1 Tax=Clavibacter michiganensis TaxID=28447 RepID=UPI001AE86103|nr:ROK family transcriptional regulator [Clavibacter michiganensis]MBP2456885.1 putative NBD/HSP70 family sugar kinase [Clavibacter michiganensis]MDQ0409455.1 putative NBD/HSP70 family sugar kinase [Clavibacter michiganensis]